MALVRSKASADLPGVDMIEGDARDEGTLTCSLVVKGAESPRLMHDPEAVPPMQRVDFSSIKGVKRKNTSPVAGVFLASSPPH